MIEQFVGTHVQMVSGELGLYEIHRTLAWNSEWHSHRFNHQL